MRKEKMVTAEPYQNIKPCPFCGWGTIVNGGLLNYRCQCNACGATTKGYPTWEMAMEAWNRRVDNDWRLNQQTSGD